MGRIVGFSSISFLPNGKLKKKVCLKENNDVVEYEDPG
jgi:hypothetical protein